MNRNWITMNHYYYFVFRWNRIFQLCELHECLIRRLFKKLLRSWLETISISIYVFDYKSKIPNPRNYKFYYLYTYLSYPNRLIHDLKQNCLIVSRLENHDGRRRRRRRRDRFPSNSSRYAQFPRLSQSPWKSHLISYSSSSFVRKRNKGNNPLPSSLPFPQPWSQRQRILRSAITLGGKNIPASDWDRSVHATCTRQEIINKSWIYLPSLPLPPEKRGISKKLGRLNPWLVVVYAWLQNCLYFQFS